jgi:hypothetical protein
MWKGRVHIRSSEKDMLLEGELLMLFTGAVVWRRGEGFLQGERWPIKIPIGGKRMVHEFQERPIKEAVEGHDGMDAEEAARERANGEGLVKEAKKAIVAFKKLHNEVDNDKGKH